MKYFFFLFILFPLQSFPSDTNHPFLKDQKDMSRKIESLRNEIKKLQEKKENYLMRAKNHERTAWRLEFKARPLSREEYTLAEKYYDEAEHLEIKIKKAYKHKEKLEAKLINDS